MDKIRFPAKVSASSCICWWRRRRGKESKQKRSGQDQSNCEKPHGNKEKVMGLVDTRKVCGKDNIHLVASASFPERYAHYLYMYEFPYTFSGSVLVDFWYPLFKEPSLPSANKLRLSVTERTAFSSNRLYTVSANRSYVHHPIRLIQNREGLVVLDQSHMLRLLVKMLHESIRSYLSMELGHTRSSIVLPKGGNNSNKCCSGGNNSNKDHPQLKVLRRLLSLLPLLLSPLLLGCPPHHLYLSNKGVTGLNKATST